MNLRSRLCSCQAGPCEWCGHGRVWLGLMDVSRLCAGHKMNSDYGSSSDSSAWRRKDWPDLTWTWPGNEEMLQTWHGPSSVGVGCIKGFVQWILFVSGALCPDVWSRKIITKLRPNCEKQRWLESSFKKIMCVSVELKWCCKKTTCGVLWNGTSMVSKADTPNPQTPIFF